VFDWQQVRDRPVPWWTWPPPICAWMDFVPTPLVDHHLRDVSLALFGEEGLRTSPFWFVGEGMVVGRARPDAEPHGHFARVTWQGA
jgi:hypothetical protein